MIKFIAALAGFLMMTAMMGSDRVMAAQSVAVTEAQNGKTVVVEKGASLIVTLESNPSTGYGWEVAKNDAAILKPFGAPIFRASAHEMPGAPGQQSFIFHATSNGKDSVVLEYRRPWEKGIAPAKTFSLIVSVE